MAYKQGNPLVKLVIFAAIVFVGYKFGIPWAREKNLLPSGGSSQRAPQQAGCLQLAEAAGDVWSSGIAQFMSPPVDASAWSGFHSEVDSALSRARSGCQCSEESCGKAKEAVAELQSLVREMDAAVRSGGPPTIDVVRAQERVDNLLNEARTLTNQGK